MEKNIISFIHRRAMSAVLQSPPFFKEYGVLLALMVLGLVIRIWVIFGQGSYWFDETIAVGIAQKSLSEFWHYLQYENNPPLYFLLLKAWGMMFGLGEHATRLFSALIGAVTIPVMYLLGKEFFDKKIGIITAAIFSVSSFAVYYTTEARMYALVFLFSALSFYFFGRLVWGGTRDSFRTSFWGYFFVTIVGLYANITGLSLILAQGSFLVLFGRRKKYARTIWLAMALALVCYAPWLTHVALMKFQLHHAGLLSQGWYFKRFDDMPVAAALPLFLLYYLPLDPLTLVLYFLLASVFVLAAARQKSGEAPSDKKVALLLMGLAFPLAVSTLTLNLWKLRYYLPSVVCFYLLFSKGTSVLLSSSRKIIRGSVWFVLGLVLFYNVTNFLLIRELDGVWDTVADVAKAQKADVIMTDLFGGALSYRRNAAFPSLTVLTSDKLRSEKNESQIDPLLYSIRYNWLYSVEDRDALQSIANQIRALLVKNPQRIVFVYLPLPQNEFARDLLIRRGFDCKDILSGLQRRENFEAVFCQKIDAPGRI